MIRGILMLMAFAFLGSQVIAQSDSSQFVKTDSFLPLKIAVFAPIYLDSAFNKNDYKLGRKNIPKYILPGLDFYHGVMLAVDSLNKEHTPIEVFFYDSKNEDIPITTVLEKPEMLDVSMIIAFFNDRTRVKPLADFALMRNIPLLSAVYPNDGGVLANPFFVMLNPTLGTHIEAIFKYIQKYYPLEKITVFTKKGYTETMIFTKLKELNANTHGIPLRLYPIELPENFTQEQVTSHLDSTQTNILLCGSLNETFGSALEVAISNKSYPTVIIGMPTWNGIKNIGMETEIIYSTPYAIFRKDKVSIQIIEKYRSLYAGRPSDLVFKGFESMYHFSKLLVKHQNGLINNLSDKSFKVFDDFDIQPVRADKNSILPDYLENKKLYFIRKLNGKFVSIN